MARSSTTTKAKAAAKVAAAQEPLPTISEQVAAQLGGGRGMIEAGVPVVAFVIVNQFWHLTPALIIAVVAAVSVGGYRLWHKQSPRSAFNGLFGVAIGAVAAWKSGDAAAFYLPGILMSLAYAVGMLVSIAVRRPAAGWLWSVMIDKGSTRWRDRDDLRRAFGWLTVFAATIFFAKVAINLGVYTAAGLTKDQKSAILAFNRLVLGYPPFALIVGLIIWRARQILARDTESATAGPAPA